MGHGGLGVRVAVMGVRVMRAVFEQLAEATLGQALAEAHRQVSAELIDGDLHHELRRVGRHWVSGSEAWRNQACGGENEGPSAWPDPEVRPSVC